MVKFINSLGLIVVLGILTSSAQAQDIFSAINSDDADQIRKILKKTPDVLNKPRPNGQRYTPLQYAVSQNRKKAVKCLLKNKADTNTKNRYGQTAMHLAAQRNNQEIIELMLEAGADVDIQDRNGYSPIWYSISYYNNNKITPLLINKSKNLKAKTRYGQTYITTAAQNGREAIVKLLLEKGADVNDTDRNGVTPFMFAMQRGHVSLIDFLIKKGANINLVDKQGRSGLTWAVMSNNLNNVQKIWDKLENPEKLINLAGKQGVTPLYQAAAYNNVKMVDWLISKGANAKTQPAKNYQGFLHLAAQNRNLDMFKKLMAQGASVSAVDNQQNTPMHYVAHGGNPNWGMSNLNDNMRKSCGEMAKLLVSKNAEVSAKNRQKKTPLEIAMSQNNYLVVDVLIEKLDSVPDSFGDGRNIVQWACEKGLSNTVSKISDKVKKEINNPNSDGRTPLFLAAMNGHTAVVKQLIAMNPSIDKKDNNGETALLAACWNGHKDAVSALLTAGASPKLVDESGQTALHLASWQGHLPVVKLLIEKKLDVNAKTSSGYTPLHGAAWNGKLDVAKILVEAGAKVDPTDSDGSTPLHKAAFRNHADMVKFLLEKGANVNAKDAIGFTALRKAKGKDAVTKILKEAMDK